MPAMTAEVKKRLNIPIDEDLHRKIKATSAANGETMIQFVVEAIQEKLQKEEGK